MKHSWSGAVCVLALLSGGVSVMSTVYAAPAHAQYMRADFDSFHAELARYGDWVYSDRWGPVWLPNADPDFHPYYSDGYWANTSDYGWTWISDYPWGDITFHYGRWVHDPYDGWMWIPGYVWSPAWVVWRTNDDFMGWMPMPPDRDFLRGSLNIGGGGLRFSINFNNYDDYYGYREWYGRDYNDDLFARNWVFVDLTRFGDRDFRRYARPWSNNRTIINNTTNITNYKVINNVIVNRSVDPRRIERVRGRPIETVRADGVLRNPRRITRVDEGRRVQQEMRQRIPLGSGGARSAPRPNADVVNALSDRVPERRGRGSGRLQARQDIERGGVENRADRGVIDPDERRDPQRRGWGDRDRQTQQRQDRMRAAQQQERRPREDQAQQNPEDRERAQNERRDRARAADQQQEQARRQRDRAERQQQQDQQADRARERDDQQRAEQQRADRERQQQAQQDRLRLERQRVDTERQQQMQLERQRFDRQRLDQGRADQQVQQERQMRQRQDQDRQSDMLQQREQNQRRAERQQAEQARAQQQAQQQQLQQEQSQQEQARRQQRRDAEGKRDQDQDNDRRGRGRGRGD